MSHTISGTETVSAAAARLGVDRLTAYKTIREGTFEIADIESGALAGGPPTQMKVATTIADVWARFDACFPQTAEVLPLGGRVNAATASLPPPVSSFFATRPMGHQAGMPDPPTPPRRS